MAGNEPNTEIPLNTTTKSTGNVSGAPIAGTEQNTKTDFPKTTGNVLEASMGGTAPKTEKTDATPNSTVNILKVPMDGNVSKTETDALLTSTPKSTVKASQIKTVLVNNVSKAVTKKDIWEFFTFSGDIHYIEMESDSQTTQHAFVTFKDSQGAETAVLLTGATIADLSVSVTLVENYQLPPDAQTDTDTNKGEVAQKAEEVVSTMLAKGFVLGKDALKKAQSFDEKHQFTSNASAKVASLDRRMGLSQKLSMGTAAMNEKMKEVNERYQVTEKTQSAIAAAEQKANTAGTALMSNPYVSSGAVWVSGAFAAITKAAGEVGSKTKEKVDKAEEEKVALNKSSSVKDTATPGGSSSENKNVAKT